MIFAIIVSIIIIIIVAIIIAIIIIIIILYLISIQIRQIVSRLGRRELDNYNFTMEPLL